MRLEITMMWLGVFAGCTVWTTVVLIFLDHFGLDLAGSVISSLATILAALLAAAMIQHQIRQNYRNQLKLERAKYLFEAENQAKLRGIISGINGLFGAFEELQHGDDRAKGPVTEIDQNEKVLAGISFDLLTIINHMKWDFVYYWGLEDGFSVGEDFRPTAQTQEELIKVMKEAQITLDQIVNGNLEALHP